MVGNEIRLRAEECLDQFHILLKIEESLQVYGKVEDLYHGNLRLDDQRARFEIWAGNIGVFADNHASLDHRLRESENARRLMIEFLGTLWSFLQRAKESTELTQSSPTDSLAPRDDGLYAHSASSAAESSFQGTETESLDVTFAENVPAFEQRLQGVEKSIDRLYRLSLQIRQPSIARQNAKAERFAIIDEDGINIDKEFSQYAAKFVAHQLPGLDQTMQERLAKGIVIRRRRFQYRQRHQRKLNSRTVVALVDRERKNKSATSTNYESTVRGVRVLAEDSTPKTNGDRPKVTIPPSQTSASQVVKSPLPMDKIIEEGSRISTTFTSTSASGNPVVIPNPPAPAQGSKEFECPYCCIFMSISYAKASHWRHHVMEDLEPYCCVFPQCTEHHVLYSNKKSWIAHMQNAHTTRWTCTSKAHKPCSFDTADAYDNHMRAEHAKAFTEAQLPLLRKRSKVPTLVTFRDCPLCGYVPAGDEVKTLPQSRDANGVPQSPEKAVSDRIIKHLAEHLEAIAIKALPWQDAEEVKSERAESKRADDGTVQSQDDPLSINKMHSDRLSVVDEHTQEKVPIVIDEDTDEYDPLFNGSYEEEWSFLPRPDYYGHERDPVLQTLLRKLYIDASPDDMTLGGPKLPAYLVPLDRDENFFAREYALKAIEDALCPGPDIEELPASKPVSYPRCYAIYGPGGMGKTQVAAHFTDLHRDKFDAVLWVHAENVSKIEQDFKDIAISLGLVAASSPDATDLKFTRDALQSWLVNPVKNQDEKEPGKTEKASWLLVFDGVEDGDVLNPYWPYDGPGSILITSRNPYSWAWSLELKPFTVSEAAEYLIHIIGKEVSVEEKSAAVSIARRLGGLPLALAQMGGIIAHTTLSFSGILESYEERGGRQELIQWTFDTVRPQLSKYEHNVASVWAFDSLGKGRHLLDILSMLDPDGIPERLFLESSVDAQFPQLMAVKADYKIARNELLARSLVTGNKGNKKLFIHRLVQDVCRTRMGAVKLRKVFSLAVALISGKWPFEKFTWRHGVARWSECEELIPHVQRLKDIFLEMAQAADSFEDYTLARLLVDAGWYCHERGKFIDGIAFNNKAQSICESLKLRALEDPEHRIEHPTILAQINYSLSEISHTRGCIAAEMNEPINALKYHKDFNNSMIKELSGTYIHDDMRLALSWNETGCAYMLNLNWLEGEKSFLKSIEEMKRMNGYRPNMVSLPVANLGLSYWLQEKYAEAEKVLLEGLRSRQEIFGEDDKVSFITGRLLHAIGNVKCSQGMMDEGRDYHHRGLLHYKTTLGNRHHRTADLFVKVADHSLLMQQYEMALVLLDHALEAYSNSYYFVPERLRASFKRMKTLRALKRGEEADTERSKCFKIYCKVFHDQAKELGSKLGKCKTKETEIKDDDVDSLIAFWSR